MDPTGCLGKTLLYVLSTVLYSELYCTVLYCSALYWTNNGFSEGYALKFQGCHHVQQWNEDADDEDDVRIMTKRLVRFRLCPTDICSNDKTAGCNAKYGDYVVDMDTFLQAYLESIQEDQDDLCQEAYVDCYNTCGADSDCREACYDGYDLSWCLADDDNVNNFNVQEYAACAQIDLNNGRRLEDGAAADDDANVNYNVNVNYNYYMGAFCADQGGEIRMGLFTDDTCTTFYQNGYDTFYNTMGYNMPFQSESMVTSRCLSCLTLDDNGNYQDRELCKDVYEYAGKCETRMSIEYPNESSCNYIEGIKIIRQDGVIRTSTTKKSKTAAVAIGLCTTLAVLLAGYVYYLRTKLGRAQINLAAASQPLNYT